MTTKVKKTGIKKTRFRVIGIVILALLVVILAFFSVYLHIELQCQRSQKENLQSQIIDLSGELSSLLTEYNNYKSTHIHNDSEYDRALFHFYYVKQVKQRFGSDSLWFELNDLNWTEPYQIGVFDCSEMSACLERYLENRGWHVKIAVGDMPSNTSVRHAWLLVETSQGQYTPLESTKIEVVREYDRYFSNYFTYDYTFETIQDLIRYDEDEYDWWKMSISPLECVSIFDE